MRNGIRKQGENLGRKKVWTDRGTEGTDGGRVMIEAGIVVKFRRKRRVGGYMKGSGQQRGEEARDRVEDVGKVEGKKEDGRTGVENE